MKPETITHDSIIRTIVNSKNMNYGEFIRVHSFIHSMVVGHSYNKIAEKDHINSYLIHPNRRTIRYNERTINQYELIVGRYIPAKVINIENGSAIVDLALILSPFADSSFVNGIASSMTSTFILGIGAKIKEIYSTQKRSSVMINSDNIPDRVLELAPKSDETPVDIGENIVRLAELVSASDGMTVKIEISNEKSSIIFGKNNIDKFEYPWHE